MSALLAHLSILVVEDDPDSRDLLELYLRSEGADVRGAGDAPSAREILASWSPDVMLVDVTLPGEDGFTFLESVRSRANAHHAAAIALTGYSDERIRARAAAAGFEQFVTKPVDIMSLPASIIGLARRPARALIVALKTPKRRPISSIAHECRRSTLSNR